MRSDLILKITDLLSPVIEMMGYELWGLEFAQSGHRTILRIYVDSDDGVNLDDCAKISSQVGIILDVEDVLAGGYDLEVSSPGLDRILVKEGHYKRFIGEIVQIKLRIPLDNRRNFKGEILEVNDHKVTVMVEGKNFVFNVEDIEKARIVPSV